MEVPVQCVGKNSKKKQCNNAGYYRTDGGYCPVHKYQRAEHNVVCNNQTSAVFFQNFGIQNSAPHNLGKMVPLEVHEQQVFHLNTIIAHHVSTIQQLEMEKEDFRLNYIEELKAGKLNKEDLEDQIVQLRQEKNQEIRERQKNQKTGVLRQFILNVEYEFKNDIIDELPQDDRESFPDSMSVDRVHYQDLLQHKSLSPSGRSAIMQNWFEAKIEQYQMFQRTIYYIKTEFESSVHSQFNNQKVTPDQITEWIKEQLPRTYTLRARRGNKRTVVPIQNIALNLVHKLEEYRADGEAFIKKNY
eukprot:TRINITY_DN9030_c0_g1_i1.p1 TRINITY_DN9030_c0_g1~~TRINITY_DN9030_c0_g1_i1.p1  ORF type:complete len:301 (-),score=50.85 TRINITY_DN9030_c0_g1_i1:16-918(-)